MDKVKLTQYSHGAGCGCKLSPAVLDQILSQVGRSAPFENLIVGNSTSDDAAVMDLGDGTGIVSTTDFFMPIVDDPFDFGKIAATNAISDVYAMGGTPLMAIAILGWPLDKLDPTIAGDVLEGGRKICEEAGIPLAGGHSIDCPEPIFGLAVTGRVPLNQLKMNSGAREGDLLFLTKGLGVGMITTGQKKGLSTDEQVAIAVKSMQTMNKIGEDLSKVEGIHALTDVTGFGLLGHLVEMCSAGNVSAVVKPDMIPTILERAQLEKLHKQGAIPGGTRRNFASYGKHVKVQEGFTQDLLCDPQTSGGLLISATPDSMEEIREIGTKYGLDLEPIGSLTARQDQLVVVE